MVKTQGSDQIRLFQRVVGWRKGSIQQGNLGKFSEEKQGFLLIEVHQWNLNRIELDKEGKFEYSFWMWVHSLGNESQRWDQKANYTWGFCNLKALWKMKVLGKKWGFLLGRRYGKRIGNKCNERCKGTR